MSDQHQPLWSDERIIQALDDGGIDHENWLITKLTMEVVRDEYETELATLQQENARLAAELAARNEKLLSLTANPKSLEAKVLGYQDVAEEWQRITAQAIERMEAAEAERDALAAELAALRDTTTQLDGSWLAMMREIAKLADAMEPDDVKWCDADDANLLEEFDPWQTLRELAALRAEARWEPVVYSTFVEDQSHNDTYLLITLGGTQLEMGTDPTADGKTVNLPSDMRLCRRVHGQACTEQSECDTPAQEGSDE